MKKNLMARRKGFKHSEETRRKMSELRKEKPVNFWLGKKRPLETRQKMSEAFKKRIVSEETKKKISKNNAKIWLGKKLPLETRLKMSMAKKGYKLSEEQKEKIRIANIGKKRSPEQRKKISEIVKSQQTPERRMSMSIKMRGENSPNWKGGISSKNKIIRNSIEFRLWREAVFARDNWTCQKCKKRGCELHPHHIKQFALFPELRFAIDNGITLCANCHKKTGSWGRLKKVIIN